MKPWVISFWIFSPYYKLQWLFNIWYLRSLLFLMVMYLRRCSLVWICGTICANLKVHVSFCTYVCSICTHDNMDGGKFGVLIWKMWIQMRCNDCVSFYSLSIDRMTFLKYFFQSTDIYCKVCMLVKMLKCF